MTLPVLKPNSPGADSIDVSQLPKGLVWYAGYVGGRWPTYSPIVQRFGKNAYVKSIAVNAEEDADVLDVEQFDATNDQAPGWFWRQRKRGAEKPAFYTSQSNIAALVATLLKAGVKRDEYLIWEAHYDHVAQVTNGNDAKQYWDAGPRGENYDRNVANPSFFNVKTVPVHHNVPNYRLFEPGPFSSPWGDLNERSHVVYYDLLRKRPKINFLRLRRERKILQFLADRIAYLSIYSAPGVKRRPADWKTARRGYRYQQIVHRAQGQRFV